MATLNAVLVVVIFACVAMTYCDDSVCNHEFRGCKIDYKTRECLEGYATGCKNPFPFKDMTECEENFKGFGNTCEEENRCKNGGTCVPVLDSENHRTYKCICEATGFYGLHCENECPPLKDMPRTPSLHAEACLY